MSSPQTDPLRSIAKDALDAFDKLNGPQPGFRPAHAKGILLAGKFTPSPSAAALTCAPHIQRTSTPVWVRFSDFAGIPAVPDNGAEASPRGIAIRFYLQEHVHTDIIAHSVDGFPARTAEEFIEFLRAIGASGPGAAKPTPIEQFLGSHPAALEFVMAPKPFPSSFAGESFFGVSAYRFINQDGVARYGRYRIRPEGAGQYLDPEQAAKQTPDYLFDEMKKRLGGGPVKMRVAVQVAEAGDPVNDSTAHWPKERSEVEFGMVELTGVVANNEGEQRHVIFDPIPRVDGIEPSDDPLLEVRATTYLMSGRRRRQEGAR